MILRRLPCFPSFVDFRRQLDRCGEIRNCEPNVKETTILTLKEADQSQPHTERLLRSPAQ